MSKDRPGYQRTLRFCVMAKNAELRTVCCIKWQKGNLYVMEPLDPRRAGRGSFKTSYHTPRDGRSQTHLAYSLMNAGKAIRETAKQTCPITDIRDVVHFCGGSLNLETLHAFDTPDADETIVPLPFDVRPFTHLRPSFVTWDVFLVPVGREDLLAQNGHYKSSQAMPVVETLGTVLDKTSVPWVAVRLIRFATEKKLWPGRKTLLDSLNSSPVMRPGPRPETAN